jgi:hypothetical protein
MHAALPAHTCRRCGMRGWHRDPFAQATAQSQYGFEPDCPVPRLTPLFFGAAKEVFRKQQKRSPPGQPAYTIGQANGQTWSWLQAMLRPLKKCTTKEITAIINRR